MNQNIVLQFGQSKTVALNPKNADGSPATLLYPPSWTTVYGSAASISVAGDGMSAVVTASSDSVGRLIVAVYADAGNEIVGFILSAKVIPSEAVTLDPVVS